MNLKKIFLVLVLVCLGVFLGWFIKPNSEKNIAVSLENRKEFSFLNPTVLSDIGRHYIINFRPLREKLESIQKKYPQKTYAYFLYLNNGSWIGINERESFTAASTVKVPLAMAVYKAIEDKKIKLTDQYTLTREDLDSDFGDFYKVGAGKTYLVEELLEVMLEFSDNTAKNALANLINQVGINNPLQPVYEFFGWTFEFGEEINFAKINLKTLSNMFLALYNGKYINFENSQDVLNHLARTPFNDKIEAGVPKGVSVSHKIGISAGDETFSDCGIVYAPNRHYLLCLGSNGGDEERASKFMAEVSEAVYGYVINN